MHSLVMEPRRFQVATLIQRMGTLALLAGWLLALSGCANWRESFLDDGVDRATQAEVLDKFGPPHQVRESLLDQESFWTYRFTMTDKEANPWDLRKRAFDKAPPPPKDPKEPPRVEDMSCYRYDLKFDRSKILREWTRAPCKTGTS